MNYLIQHFEIISNSLSYSLGQEYKVVAYCHSTSRTTVLSGFSKAKK